MSRTEIYKMIENQNINLSLGNNALDVFTNGAGFLENISNKCYGGQQTADLTSGFDSAPWLMEFIDDVDNAILGEEPFTLDDILEGKAVNNCGIITTEILDESPMASPLSSSDESCYDLDELLFSASPEDVLASKTDSSSVPLAEHMYAITTPVVTNIEDNLETTSTADYIKFQVPSPVYSDDSGFQSGEESVLDTDDLLSQLLLGTYDFNLIEAAASSEPILSTVDEDALNVNYFDVQKPTPVDSQSEPEKVTKSRPSPYKKKSKTTEQKQRKKAQNRTAALRYRSKKNVEMEQIFNEADELEGKNKELHSKVDGLKGEIDYLKNLMLDVIKARLSSGGSLPEELNAFSLLSN